MLIFKLLTIIVVHLNFISNAFKQVCNIIILIQIHIGHTAALLWPFPSNIFYL